MKKNIELKYLYFIIIIYIVIFQNFLEDKFTLFRYFDEFLALLSIPAFFINVITKKNKANKKKYFLLLSLAIIGLIGSLKYKYQPFNVVLADMLLVFKFFLVIYIFNMILNSDFIVRNSKKISFHIRLITIFMFILTIFNYIFTLYPSEIRFGILSNRLFYTHPTYLAGITVFLLALYIMVNKKIVDKYVLIILLLLFSTLRIKAICSVIAIIIMLYFINKSNKKLSVLKLLFVFLIILVISFNQLSFYFFNSNDDNARKQLLEKSVLIAKDCFPIGTGFATFGSYYSGVNYSQVYYIYKINNVYGIQPNFYSYIADSFWPMIVGQFGILGFCIYLMILIIIFKEIQSIYSKENKRIYMAKIISFIYLLIISFAESSFTSSIAIPLALIISINVNSQKEMYKLCD